MSLSKKYLKVLLEIIPAGAVGASLLLGPAAPSVAKHHPPGLQPPASDEARVSERLAAIREAVSAVAKSEGETTPGSKNLQLSWGNRWGNWGWGPRRSWGWPWNNWRNGPPSRWNNWWRNW
jgi:hypothetical protein